MLKPSISNLKVFDNDLNIFLQDSDTIKGYNIENNKLSSFSLDEVEFSNSILNNIIFSDCNLEKSYFKIKKHIMINNHEKYFFKYLELEKCLCNISKKNLK